ncbi:MAG TPA: hypothetical protein VLM05_02435 [Mycobacteriales bacterium]|nr:hypothetical protein [Mycobacteriales bacterium]
MRSAGQGVALAVPFVWLGMVLAISGLEAPLKFRAPGITLPLGLGIGRLVFAALNVAEIALAALLTLVCVALRTSGPGWALLAGTWLLLAVQIGVLRPRLNRRTSVVIAGRTPAPSRLHLVYIALEAVKIPLLVALGAVLIAAALP